MRLRGYEHLLTHTTALPSRTTAHTPEMLHISFPARALINQIISLNSHIPKRKPVNILQTQILLTALFPNNTMASTYKSI